MVRAMVRLEVPVVAPEASSVEPDASGVVVVPEASVAAGLPR